eukprot:TRINITY_DN7450_c0_g1_i2.p1 TRINITY_DN7450_c0_g1~~TRINITY_DN7450_c0_g1_i2.p1  ORF type:complete len:419 (+),score=77.61 TRINITY_DN7450_c0_g1_i2:95-1351(+)
MANRRGDWHLSLMQEFPQEYHEHLSRFPTNYMLEVQMEDVAVHMKMLHQIANTQDSVEVVCIHITKTDDGCFRVAIAVKDQAYLLHTISATFANLMVSVLEAHIFCTKDGYVLDFFTVNSEMEMEELQESLRLKLTREVKETMASQERLETKSPIPRQAEKPASTGISISAPTFKHPKIQFNDLRLVERIVENPSSELWKATLKNSNPNTFVAVKLLSPEQALNPAKRDEFINEIKVLGSTKHPNVVQYIGSCTVSPHYFIVTELLGGGSLYDILHSRIGKVNLSPYHVARDVAAALEYLHSCNYIHRDLKSQNILYDIENQVFKVIDFGVARQHGDKMTGETGSYRWMAPEVLNHQNYTFKADVYSFGMVLWETVAREVPFKYLTPLQAAMRVSTTGRYGIMCIPRLYHLPETHTSF